MSQLSKSANRWVPPHERDGGYQPKHKDSLLLTKPGVPKLDWDTEDAVAKQPGENEYQAFVDTTQPLVNSRSLVNTLPLLNTTQSRDEAQDTLSALGGFEKSKNERKRDRRVARKKQDSELQQAAENPDPDADPREVEAAKKSWIARATDRTLRQFGSGLTYNGSRQMIGSLGARSARNIPDDSLCTGKYKVKFKDQKPGVLTYRAIWVPHVPREGYTPKGELVVGVDGIQYEHYYRFCVIESGDGTSQVTEFPCLTHGGMGLVGKDPNFYNPGKFLNLKPYGCKNYEKQSKNMPTLEIEYVTGHPKIPDAETMLVNFFAPNTRDTNHYDLQVAGKLTLASTAMLKKYSKRRVDGLIGPADEDRGK